MEKDNPSSKIPSPCKEIYFNLQNCLKTNTTTCSYHYVLYNLCLKTTKYGTFY